MGSSRILNAGSFSSYKWSDGSTARTLEVNHTGIYAVDVQDAHGCKGSDTTIITELLPVPGNFLPADTAICSYGSLTLKPIHLYNSYIWSNNATASSITITQPGRYWLQVKDVNQCIGRDTILVNVKDCMTGFYIPTAFTPDGDGKNDAFRPLLFGRVKKYSFTVYNHWGQVVFQSSELGKGWSGTYASSQQDSNVFAWICTYQFEGQEVKAEKGTVVLIR
jgi:gliding motility-associated-like protein